MIGSESCLHILYDDKVKGKDNKTIIKENAEHCTNVFETGWLDLNLDK